MFFLWTLYLDALQNYPLLTKCFTSLVGFIVGDTIAQLLTRDHRFSGLRTLRFAIIGFLLHAPVVSAWLTVLDAAVYPDAPSSMGAVLVKMALDQLVMSPLFLLVFFAAVKLLEGQLHRLHEVLREKYLRTLAAGYLLWPLALIISFRYVPSELRILYLNCVQVGWNIILCNMSAVRAKAGALGLARLAGTPRKHSDEEVPVAAHPAAAQLGLAERRPSSALQMRGSGSLKPKSEEFWQHVVAETHSPHYAAENAARL